MKNKIIFFSIFILFILKLSAQNSFPLKESYLFKDLKFQLEIENLTSTKDAISPVNKKSFLIPAWEVTAFIFLLNQYDRVAYSKREIDGKKIYNTNFSTVWEQLTKGKWSTDNDSFEVNQFGHPYQGSVYFGFARSAGLNYYQSFLYSTIGSYIWETGGETTHPSLNDQIASGIGGSFIGEALFRMANLFL